MYKKGVKEWVGVSSVHTNENDVRYKSRLSSIRCGSGGEKKQTRGGELSPCVGGVRGVSCFGG